MWITDVKYSPDSRLFGVASADHRIYVYENNRKSRYKLLSVAEKHNSVVTSIDFSAESHLIQSDSLDHEHLCCKLTGVTIAKSLYFNYNYGYSLYKTSIF